MNNSGGRSGKSWYQRWHESDHRELTHWLIFLVIVVVAGLLLWKQIFNFIISLNQPGIQVSLTSPATQLSLDPQSKTVIVGDTFPVNIDLDTGGNKVDGVDVYALHFDPSLLQVVDDNPSKAGVQVQPGQILDVNAANIVDNKAGTIKLSQITPGGTSFQGTGVVATIHFKAVSSGTAYLKFDFTPGSTTDSNAAYKGKDQLSKVVDGIFIIDSK